MLQIIPDPEFNDPSAWVIPNPAEAVIENGTLRLINHSGAADRPRVVDVPFRKGYRYTIEIEVVSYTAGRDLTLLVMRDGGATPTLKTYGVGGVGVTPSPGVYRFEHIAGELDREIHIGDVVGGQGSIADGVIGSLYVHEHSTIYNTFRHLLPRARAWNLNPISKFLSKYFHALSISPNDIRLFLDLIFLDILPNETREIELFESQFGLIPANLTEQQRRDRLTAAWRQQGGQSPRYIEDQLRAAGFDVYVHEWWEIPVIDDPVARNPNVYLVENFVQAGEPDAQAGEPLAQAGNFIDGGYILANKQLIYVRFLLGMGNEAMCLGNANAICGRRAGAQLQTKTYDIPEDSDLWRHFIYIGAEEFPEIAIVDTNRRNEFETLCLKLRPAEKWLGMLIQYEGDTT